MYICHDCTKEFEVPIVGADDYSVSECCPNCGSDDINEVDPCDGS